MRKLFLIISLIIFGLALALNGEAKIDNPCEGFDGYKHSVNSLGGITNTCQEIVLQIKFEEVIGDEELQNNSFEDDFTSWTKFGEDSVHSISTTTAEA